MIADVNTPRATQCLDAQPVVSPVATIAALLHLEFSWQVQNRFAAKVYTVPCRGPSSSVGLAVRPSILVKFAICSRGKGYSSKTFKKDEILHEVDPGKMSK